MSFILILLTWPCATRRYLKRDELEPNSVNFEESIREIGQFDTVQRSPFSPPDLDLDLDLELTDRWILGDLQPSDPSRRLSISRRLLLLSK